MIHAPYNRAWYFVALPGAHTDGHQYVHQAVAAGALAVVVNTSRRPQLPLPSTAPVYACDDTYKALGALSSRFHGDPGHQLHLIGVTGTNGKTTVTHLIEKMLADCGEAGRPGRHAGTASAQTWADNLCEYRVDHPTGRAAPRDSRWHGARASSIRGHGSQFACPGATSHLWL